MQSDKETNSTHIRKRKRDISKNLLEWENLFSSADDLKQINQSITINLNLASLININFNQFWRYTGSLTTPPCTEGIIWSVFKQAIVVNDDQLQLFRNDLYSKDYREPQPLYHRIVYRSFRHNLISTKENYLCCSRKSS